MRNEKLFSEYIKHSKVLLSTLNLEKKNVEVFDSEGNKTFTYQEFFLFVANYFDLIPDFVDKSIIVLETVDPKNELLEISTELKKTSGKIVNYKYHIIRQTQNEFLFSIQEVTNVNVDQLDHMTKANPKSYIDNRAKNNLLTKTPFVLVYLDIDNFRYINDEYGQNVGDMILIEMVSVIKDFIGEKGAISRVGGDKFLIIYDISDDYDSVHDFMFQLKIKSQEIQTCNQRGIHITVTTACARSPYDGTDYELLTKKCQKALIRGKNKGRDCFIIYLVDKCGEVTKDDVIDDSIIKIENVSANNNVYSLITDVNQLLADEQNFDEAIDKAIALVGNYFYVDRISVARVNIKTHKIFKHHVYFNPKCSIKYDVYCIDDIIPDWALALGNKYFVKVEDYNELPETSPLYKLFPVDHTMATLSYELVLNGKSFGIIRFDMTTGKRLWQPDVEQVFMLVSQILTSYLQKNYLKDTNYKTLYLDNKYGCYNFVRLFRYAGDYIINNDITHYSILEFDIKNIINYRMIIGESRMLNLVNSIVDVLKQYKNDIIYGKKSEGPFDVFFKNQDKNIIEELFNKVVDVVKKFSHDCHIKELIVYGGAYLSDEEDRLIDALSNANVTRNICKTQNNNSSLMFYSEEIKAQSIFKNEMILRVDEALEKNEFLLYLQPKISTTDETLVGAEALTRWNFKGERLLFPNQFISMFEEQGVIEKLDFSVFENVCKYQKMLLDKNLKPVPISVNVSRYVSNFGLYIDKLEQIRKKYDLEPKYIEIEITEGMYYENSLIISEFIEKLHNLGYKVSMDDFGSGYSNLVAMAKLNFDVIKFDKSFCIDLDNDNVKVMLFKLIELIKTLKMKTLCEGVETKENVDFLASIGCDSIQGFYYSKPIPWEEFFKKYYK